MATPYLQYGNDGLSGFDANGVRRIWLDPLNLLFSFFDANGIPRCEIGNLPARGASTLSVGVYTSPAHWGFRVNDATGAPIYDSQGLIQVLTQIATTGDLGIGSQTIVLTTGANPSVTGSPISFTLTRQATVEIRGYVSATISIGGNTGTVQIHRSSGTPAFYGTFATIGGPPPAYSNPTIYTVQALAAGSYTFELTVNGVTGQSMFITTGRLDAFLLGG